METQFGSARPWQADEGTDALAVQVIALVQPPASLDQALLRETLNAVLAAPVARRVLAFGGPGGDWLPAGFDLMGQRGGDFGERMAGGVRRRLRHGGAAHAADPGGRPGRSRRTCSRTPRGH